MNHGFHYFKEIQTRLEAGGQRKPDKRGGAAKSEVRISKSEYRMPKIRNGRKFAQPAETLMDSSTDCTPIEIPIREIRGKKKPISSLAMLQAVTVHEEISLASSRLFRLCRTTACSGLTAQSGTIRVEFLLPVKQN